MADNLESCELTLHIVLATIPQKQEYNFDKSIQKEYYGKFREKSSNYYRNKTSMKLHNYSELDEAHTTKVLYNPLRYYILGNYDIVYISLINNLKFAQRLFESSPANSGPDKIFPPHTFQSFTGINYHTKKELKDFFYHHLHPGKDARKYFVGICNLKLNNGFLIGNGNTYIKAVLAITKETIKVHNDACEKKKKENQKVEFLILQSFSWFEFSLLIFTDDTQAVADLLRDLRRLTLKELNNNQLLDDSLYKAVNPTYTHRQLEKANVFADTHTYIGLHADLLNKEKAHEKFVKKFKTAAPNIKLKTDIEWQIKPGHMHLLMSLLAKKIGTAKGGFKMQSRYLLTGKTDYLLYENSESVLTNYYLMQLMLDPKGKLPDHVRKIRTRVLFKGPAGSKSKVEKKTLTLEPALKAMAIDANKIKAIDERLKALKISRQIKSKILKIFSNFNNGIQDVILFPFFLDFKIFIDELRDTILKEFTLWEESNKNTAEKFFHLNVETTQQVNNKKPADIQSVDDLERKLIKRINVFEEAYNLRMMNCYQFEDITDFDLDFNGSVQQLLSAYSSLIAETGNIFYDNERKYQFGPLVQLNLKDTQGNYSSINYHVHHLISPEFVFATVTKEVLNNEEYDAPPMQELQKNYNSVIGGIASEYPYLYEMIEEGAFDFSYFVNDAVRFVISYDMDFELFYYWFWMYNLQNPLLYDKRGMMNERHFIKELFRIILIARYFKVPIDKVKYPVEEVFTYWDRHFHKVDEYAVQYLDFLDKTGILKTFTEYMVTRFENFLTVLVPDTSEKEQKLPLAKEKIEMFSKANVYEVPVDELKKYYLLHMAYDRFNSGEMKKEEENSILAIHYFMKKYLESIYQKNNKEISFLRRDWVTGLPLESFIKHNKSKHLYCVDQTGGLFFDNMDELNTYLLESSKTISHILHYSLVVKKQFILYKQKSTI